MLLRNQSLRAFPITIHFVRVLQCGGDCPHVSLNSARPALHVPELLETRVEAVDQEQPGGGLLRKVGRVQVQLLRLRVKPLLVQICLEESWSN